MVRQGLGERLTADLPAPTLYYAVGQGALCIEIREGDARARAMCAALSHWPTAWACGAERACLRVLEGGCSVPVGATSSFVEKPGKEGERRGTLRVTGCVTSLRGDRHVERTVEAEVASEEEVFALGEKLAQGLIESGAKEILAEINEDRARRVAEAKATNATVDA